MLLVDVDVSFLKLRSALSDLTVWPDTQTAEVHTQFEASRSCIETSIGKDSISLLFYYLHPDFQGCGLGSKMLAEVQERAEELNQQLPFTAVFRVEDVDFGTICGFKHTKNAGKLKVLERVC